MGMRMRKVGLREGLAGNHYSKSYFARENTDAKAIKLLGGWLLGCQPVGEYERE